MASKVEIANWHFCTRYLDSKMKIKKQKSSTWQIVTENHLLIMFNKIGFVEIEKSAELEASWQKMKYGDRRQISKYQGG